ncbi:MAG TPA: leucyl aminopeptidase [Candidatus Limnocylindrales bacterium]|nr:leucyl aminopeptidase [Candidatus Limnocylindrales bacterium]
MRIRIVTGQPWEAPADVLVVPVVGEPDLSGALGEVDRRSGGELATLHAFGELRGKPFSTSMGAAGDLPAKRLVTVSSGAAEELDRETVRKVGATGIRRLTGRQANTLAVWLDPLAAVDGGIAGAAELIARGVVEGSFEPKAIYREDTDAAPPAIDELILVASGGDAGSLEKAAERGRIMGEGANIARRLANRSANDISPQVLADEASALASEHGLFIDVVDEKRAKEMGMGMFLAVGQGSDNPPRMIVLRSGDEGAKDEAGRHLALIGKGVCFDSGGISIKPADRMEEMKMDKTGACTVIAAIATAARLAPGMPLLAVAPAVENMPGGHATRPGDIVQALNGKWVDIINTDAEGRLILGDAMTYAEQLGATHMVDVATLTGAVGRAIGNLVTGAFATPDPFWEDLAAAASKAGERYWRFPLIADIFSEMDSWYGDFQNTGTADGSLVKSGLFLEQFRTVPWAHLDIGGTAYFRKAYPYAARGATGVTHATLVEMALAGASKA